MSDSGCKVDEAIREYDLRTPDSDTDGLDAYLAARWIGTDDHQSVGYRTLSDWFNRQLLKQVYDRHGRGTTGTRIDSEHDALTGDDELLRDEVVAGLESDGIDGAALREAMVSPRTMHRHLTDCLGVEKGRASAETDWERRSVEMARSQLAEKVAKATSALDEKAELLGAADAEIEIQVSLSCPECPTRVSFETALRNGYVCKEHSVDVTEAESVVAPIEEYSA